MMTMRTWSSTRSTVALLCVLLMTSRVNAQKQGPAFYEPEGERREQTFSVLEFENGNINQRYDGPLRYYCTFRGKWSEERHPLDFPKSPSWSAPVIISHSNGWRMWTGSETATLGVESIAEEGFATIITNEFYNAGFETLQLVLGERMFNTTESQHLPPINVTFEHPFLSAMVKMSPSPDWFVGFSDLRTISPVTETYYNRIVIRSWVWDSGTDSGGTYTALDRDLDPQIPVARMTKNSVPPKGQFLDPTGTFIPIPAEFECILRVGDGQIISGVPFDEVDLRPELHMPRDDDFIDGMPPGHGANGKNGNNGKGGNGKDGSVSVSASVGLLGALMMGVAALLV